MERVYGIYGYEFTKPFEVGPFKFKPRTENALDAKTWARDRQAYHLTGYLIADEVPPKSLFRLSAVLSFIEHLDVLILEAEDDAQREGKINIPRSIEVEKRNSGGGPVIVYDIWHAESRSEFINCAMSKLRDRKFCDSTQFDVLFHKKVATFRQNNPFVEVTYFLLFSGLESFARAILSDTQTRDAAKPINEVLRGYGFNIDIATKGDFVRSLRTYTKLRNSLFHNSALSTEVKIDSERRHVEIFDFLFHLQQLVTLVILKVVDFDDGYINWDSWVDRQPWQSVAHYE